MKTEHQYNKASQVIALLKEQGVLKAQYTYGEVFVDDYEKLWDTVFQIIDIVEEK